MKRLLTIIIPAPLLLAGCLTGGSGGGTPDARRNLKGTLPSFCPIGVTCDEHYVDHAYLGQVDSIRFYFSFQPGFLSNKTSAGAKTLFNYMYLSVGHPGLKTDTSVFSHSMPTLWETPAAWGAHGDSTRHEITGFSGDTLYGTVHLHLRKATEWIHSRADWCISDDIMGICAKDHDMPLDLDIDYAIKLDESRSVAGIGGEEIP